MLIRHIAILLFSCSLFTSTVFCKEKADAYYENAIRLHGAENLEKVFELYARSAELGNAFAQYNIAMMYSNGESVYVDYQQAVYWFNKSSDQGFPPAQYRLGEMYYFEKGGLPRDLDRATALFRKAADQDDPDAQMNLAMLYGTGESLAADSRQALFWLERARQGGHASAFEYKKMIAASPDGLFTADQQRRYWLEKAAELGIREAQIALGLLQAESG